MTYDPTLRRNTPLAALLRQRLATGPMPLSAYIHACLNHPEHGYYRARPVLGRAGDFITAPEISQTFGEMIGLWIGAVWESMGSPTRLVLMEFGPGRGTLMADALRALRVLPTCLAAIEIRLIEPSPVLAQVQRATLAPWADCIRWIADSKVGDIATVPTVMIGNEYLDVFPARQLVQTERGWVEQGVGLDAEGRLLFVPLDEITEPPPAAFAQANIGTIYEESGVPVPKLVVRRLHDAHVPFAALYIDYGHTTSALGDTLQAVRAHAHEHPLTSPGEADLTFQVDFAQVAAAFLRVPGAAVDGPVTQAEFLGRLGIVERAQRLMGQNPSRALEIEAAVGRLIAPNAMGTRFKAMGWRSAGLAPLPGLSREAQR